MRKKLLVWAMLCAALACCVCGAKRTDGPEPPDNQTNAAEIPAPPEEPAESVLPDFSGSYTDRQGTAEVYSQLTLELREDGSYSAVMRLYRLALLEGTAEYRDGTLHFVCPEPAVEADVTVSGQTAEAAVTASEFAYIEAGSIYRFPDGPENGPGSAG